MFSEKDLKELGIAQYGTINPSEIPFLPVIREICQGNGCGQYGKTWACPPAVGTLEECRSRCLAYEKALVFNAVYPLEDSFDYEGMMAGHRAFKALCDQLYALAKPTRSPFLLLSNEGCTRCQSCTYPDSPCRMPELLFPSVEGFGIHVGQLAQKAGLTYINGENTVTYFGVLLYHSPEEKP